MNYVLCVLLVFVIVEFILPLPLAFLAKHLPTGIKTPAIKCCATIGACGAVVMLYFFKRKLRRKISKKFVCHRFKELAEEFIEDETYGDCYKYMFNSFISHKLNVAKTHEIVKRFYKGE